MRLLFADGLLTRGDGGPEVVVEDAQLRDLLAHPVSLGIKDGGAFAGVRGLAEVAAIIGAHPDVELLAQDAVLGATIVIGGRRGPISAPRARLLLSGSCD